MFSWISFHRGKLFAIFVTVGVLLGLCFCVPLYLVWGNSNFICFSTPFPSYQSVEERAYLKFPASARNIEFHANGVNRKAGCTIWVKFEMDIGDLDTFVASTFVENLSPSAGVESDTFEFYGAEPEWGQPQISLAGSGAPDINEDQWVFINTANPYTWTVYLITNKEWL